MSNSRKISDSTTKKMHSTIKLVSIIFFVYLATFVKNMFGVLFKKWLLFVCQRKSMEFTS